MKILLYFLTSLFYVFSFPCFNQSYLAWVCLVPFIFAVDKEKKLGVLVRNAFLCGWAVYLVGMYWLSNVTWVGYVTLSAYLSLYMVFFAIMRFYNKDNYIVPFLWVVLEFVRGNLCGGMPWHLLGASQSGYYELIQIASVTGVYGVSFLVVFINTSIVASIKQKRLYPLIISVVVLVVIHIYGISCLNENKVEGENITIAVVQPNLLLEEKWDPNCEKKIVERLEKLTKDAMPADIVLWPETTVQMFSKNKRLKNRIEELSRDLQCAIIVGSQGEAVSPLGKSYYNSAFFITPEDGLNNEYRKLHLVPFGEYVPLEKYFPFLRYATPIEDEFRPGSEFTIFDYKTKNLKIASIICFEDTFPGLVRKFVLNGASLLVNLTNDTWFGYSPEPYQHAALSIFRAVENGVYLARSTNTGLSCLVDPYGRIKEIVQDQRGEVLYIEGYFRSEIVANKGNTFYTTYGNIFIWIISVALLLMISLRRIYDRGIERTV